MAKLEKSETCLNCEAPLSGENFCSNCGQKNDASKLTLKHVLSESVSNLFAFDGRFFYTLRNLLLRPGKVPAQYVEGKRMRFMNPVRIYFLTSVILLGIIQIKDGATSMVDINTSDEPASVAKMDSTKISVDNLSAPVDASVPTEEAPPFLQKIGKMGDFYKAHKSMPMQAALDSLGYEYTLMNRFMYKQGAKVAEFDTEKFNRFLFSKMFWVLFLFLPLLALILKLLYVRRRFYYPEHLFFAFYNQSVFFLLLSIAFLFNNAVEVVLLVLVMLSFAIYLFIAMKRFYKQSTRKTLLKFVFLNIAMVPSFLIFFAFSAFVALLFY